jgi:hypothetical protein
MQKPHILDNVVHISYYHLILKKCQALFWTKLDKIQDFYSLVSEKVRTKVYSESKNSGEQQFQKAVFHFSGGLVARLAPFTARRF